MVSDPVTLGEDGDVTMGVRGGLFVVPEWALTGGRGSRSRSYIGRCPDTHFPP